MFAPAPSPSAQLAPPRDGHRPAPRWCVALVLLAGLAVACGAQAPTPVPPGPPQPPAPSAEDEQAVIAQLTKQAEAWDQAIVRKDRAAIAANMAEDFRQIDGDANLETKASFVDGVVADALQIDPYTVEEFEIRRYGEVALLSGKTRMTGRYNGEPFTSNYRYIDIYVRRDGEWKIVSVQISRIRE
ncbi:MAG: nuclear transport factor 2 family protein [Kofleriaceae bacterium]